MIRGEWKVKMANGVNEMKWVRGGQKEREKGRYSVKKD